MTSRWPAFPALLDRGRPNHGLTKRYGNVSETRVRIRINGMFVAARLRLRLGNRFGLQQVEPKPVARAGPGRCNLPLGRAVARAAITAYDRPPLSKQILAGTWERVRALFVAPQQT